ncbi:MAG: S-layer homology domain-containing protein [Clostridia bacterium]|nr:S-layer homology domain-containing protein [Clostridia bacterium]
MNKIFKRFSSILVSLTMLVSLVPVVSLATDVDNGNLIINGGFEEGTLVWGDSGNRTIYSENADNIYEGNSSAYLSAGANHTDIKQFVDVPAGKPCIVSYMGKAADAEQSVILNLSPLDSDGVHKVPFRATSLEPVPVTLTNSEWKEVFYTFVPGEDVDDAELYTTSWAGITNPIYVDNVFVGELLIGDLKFKGDMEVSAPKESGYSVQTTLNAEAYNQLGTKGGLYTAAETGSDATYTVSWALAENYDGVSLNGSTVTVTDSVDVSEIQVEATATLTYPGVSEENQTSFTKIFTLDVVEIEIDALGDSLITNGGFEDGLDGWPESTNTTIYSENSDNIYAGSNSAYMNVGANHTDLKQFVNASAGKPYIVSYMGKAADAEQNVLLALSDLTSEDAGHRVPFINTLEKSSATLTSDSWTNLFYTFAPSSNVAAELYMLSWLAIDNPIYIDNIYLGELQIKRLQYTGDTLNITTPGEGQTETVVLDAEPYNQLGTKGGLYTAEETGADATYSISWELEEEYEGVSLDGSAITVSDDANVGQINVKATAVLTYPGIPSENQTSFEKTFTLNILEQMAPEAQDVSIDGIVAAGNILTGEYTYYDANDDKENGTSFQWKISDTEEGPYTDIPGAVTNELEVTYAMANKYIMFCVIPRNAKDGGGAEESDTVFYFVDPSKDGNAELEEILIDGSPIENFRSDRTTYTVEIPYVEGMDYPIVSATAKSGVANVTITQVADFASSAEILVVSENNANAKVYTIEFIYTGKDNITVDNLFANGGFENGLTGWIFNEEAVSINNEDSENVYEGNNSVLLSSTTYSDFTYYPKMTSGKTYLFSFMAKAKEGSHQMNGLLGVDDSAQAPFLNVVEQSKMTIHSDKWTNYSATRYPIQPEGATLYLTNWSVLPDTYIDNLYLGELLISDLQYNGKNEMNIPKSNEADNYMYLTAVPYNQLGTTAGFYSAEEVGAKLENYKITWELEWDYPGVIIEGNKLIITNAATEGKIDIKAICTPLYPGAKQAEFVKRFRFDLIAHNETTPRILNAELEGVLAVDDVITGEYTYYQVNNEPEGESEYQWYYSESADGPYNKIEGANEKTLTIKEDYMKGFIKFGVVPKTQGGVSGKEVLSNYICAPTVPTATVDKVSGVRAIGQELKGSYTYFDINGDKEAGTSVKWMISSSENGEYTDIDNATSDKLIITESMKDHYVKFCVTPKNLMESGVIAYSEPVLAAAAPTIENLKIKKVSSGSPLYYAEYDYVHPCGVAEGKSKYEWIMDGKVVSTQAQFDSTKAKGTTLSVRITPVATLQPATGSSVEKSIQLEKGGASIGGSGGSAGGILPGPSAEPVVSVKPVDKPRHWAQDAIDIVVKKGIMEYPQEGNFQMDRLVTRAEFIYYVAKAAGLTESSYQNEFTDVNSGDYYAKMLQSAVDAGIISKDENFYPNRNVSREEICKIVTLAAKAYNEEGSLENIDKYTDKTNMASWAVPYIRAAVNSGLLIGVSETEFMPKGMVTRAQTAVIIKRILDSLN